MSYLKLSIIGCVVLAGSLAGAQNSPATSVGQSAADVLREFTGADAAFLPSGLLNANADRADLSSLIKDATEEPVVLSLTGTDVRAAFERALSLYPGDNNAFLQISGFEVSFSRSAEPGKRVLAISRDGARISDGQTFSVAMPASLARGGFGYFRIWDRAKITRKFAGTTLTSVLKGKRASDSPSRWQPQ
mgnify:CR=1 FL=1